MHKPIFTCGFSLEMLPVWASFEFFVVVVVQLLEITPTPPHPTLYLFFFVLDIELRAGCNIGMISMHVVNHWIIHAASGFFTVKVCQCNDLTISSIKCILILYGIIVCPCQFLHFMSLLIYVECCLFCCCSRNLKLLFVLNTLKKGHQEGWSDSCGLLYPFPVLFT